MTGRFHYAQHKFPEGNFVAIAHTAMGIGGPGFCANHNRCAGTVGKLTVATNKIRVQMRLNHILDSEPLRLRFRDVLVHVALRIDYGSFAFRTDQVRSMRETREIELFEEHKLSLVLVI